jgi:hypothetical protein
VAKVIQLIDNIPHQSHKPSQKLRNPPQQPQNPPQKIYAIHSNISATLLGNTSLIIDGLCCRPILADGIRCTCIPDFGGESHTTDRQYNPAVSQSVTAVAQSATAEERASLQFSSALLEQLLIISAILYCSVLFTNEISLLVAGLLVAKVIQLIDNTPQQSHNSS